MSLEWVDFNEREHAIGRHVDILNKTTGKITYKKKLNIPSLYGDHYPANVDTSDGTGVAYLTRKFVYSQPYDYSKTRLEYTKPVILADHQFRDWGRTRDVMIKKHLKVGDFVELTGIRDTGSFRKITDINDSRIFGVKYIINHKDELQMLYETSDNSIRFITGILDKEALDRGEWIKKVDFSKNAEY